MRPLAQVVRGRVRNAADRVVGHHHNKRAVQFMLACRDVWPPVEAVYRKILDEAQSRATLNLPQEAP